MNLDEIIDILLNEIYQNKNNIGTMGRILKSRGVDYNIENSRIICDKVKSLPYFKILDASTLDGTDLVLDVNSKGFELISNYQSYSNYKKITDAENKKEKGLFEKDAKGSYFAGIGAIIAIPISILSFFYTFYQDTTQKSKDKEFNDSLKILKIELIELRKSIRKHEILHSNMDSLVNVKKK